MFNWNQIQLRSDYEAQRYRFLLRTEEDNGIAKLTPYHDGVGNMTIGVGFNLTTAAVRMEVLAAFGLVRNNPALSTQGQAIENDYIRQAELAIGSLDFVGLDAVMAARAADLRPELAPIVDRRSTFAFGSEGEVEAVFARLMTSIYEPKVATWFPGIPDSKERVALISLAWNQKDTNPLLGPGLHAAITADNRAEAWYEIRYNSNSARQAPNIRNGIAKRRYYEAQVFGLYDNAASVTADQAKQAYRMLTKHRTQILRYERDFGTDANGTSPEAPEKRIAAANNNYQLSGVDKVQTLVLAFNAAKDVLTAELSSLYPQLSVAVDRSTDIYLASDVGPGAVLDATLDKDPSGNERAARNILIGGGEGDTLIAGGGDDLLLGGPDTDALVGGAGSDTYLWNSGDGVDHIADFQGDGFGGDGAGKIVFLGADLTGTKSPLDPLTDTGVYQDAGGFRYALTGVTSGRGILTITKSGETGGVNVLGFASGDLGITLASPTVTKTTTLGTPESDRLGAGPDSNYQIFGLAGSDLLTTGPVSYNEYYGGPGRDVLVPFGFFLTNFGGPDKLYGEADNDVLQGGAGDDVLDGAIGDDLLDGGQGSDVITGGDGHDFLVGGGSLVPDLPGLLDPGTNLETLLLQPFGAYVVPGETTGLQAMVGSLDVEGDEADVLDGGAGNDTAFAGAGDDLVFGGDDDDFLDGEQGDDTLIGAAGVDHLWGDGSEGLIALVGPGGFPIFTPVEFHGNDLLLGGAGDDQLVGDAGSDRLYGEDGDDRLFGDINVATQWDRADYLDGGAGADVLYGQGGDDTLLGGTEGDFLYGDAGADLLDGGSGADYLEGGSEADTLYGGTEADTLLGDTGEDLLDGGDGDDTLIAGNDSDTLIGGPGADTMIGGQGDDTYQVSLAEGDRIVDDQGGNLIALGDAPDPTSIVAVSATVDGQAGIMIKTDTLSSTGLFVQGGLVLLDASNPTYQFADGSEVEHSLLMETVFTEALALTGTSIGDALKGYAGADLIQGLAGDDWLAGGAADDILEGGEGNDELIGGAGADTLRGGLGDDTYPVDAADAVEELVDEGVDTVLADFSYALADNVEWLTLIGDAVIDATGNALANTLTGNTAANVLEGGAGDDALAGGAGDDEYLLSLGDGFDTIEDALGANAIRFGVGVDPASLTVSQFVGDDGATYLEIGYGPEGDSVAIRDGLLGHVGQYRFADGTVRTHEDVLANLGALAVEGSAGGDVIVGGAGPDVIDGAAGADQLFGRGADDLLKGGDEDDALWGEAGNDVLDGGAGADALTGGEGEDTYLVAWGMGADSINEDAGGLNHLRLGTAVEFEDLVASRSGDDLVVSLRGGSNRVSIVGYYATTRDWLVTDSAAETRTLADVIAQSPSGPPDPIEAEIDAYKEKVLRELYSTQNFSVLSGGQLGRSVSHVTSTFTDTTLSVYTLQEVVQASDDGFIFRDTPSSEFSSETTTSESTITVYSIDPGSRTVADALAANGAANNGTWRYMPIETIIGVPLGSLSNRIGVSKEAGDGSSSPLPYAGIWEFTPAPGGGAGELPTLSNPVVRTVTLTDYRTEETLTLNLEEIRAGSADSFIQTGDYSVVDAGAGNDVVWVANAPDYLLPDAPGNGARIGSFLYGNDGDDSLTGGDGNDVLIGGAGADSLDGGTGADLYLGAGGDDYVSDEGDDLDRYLKTYYTIENFSDLVLREEHAGQYYDKRDADFYRLDDGSIPWGNPDVNVDFYDTPEDGLASVLSGLEFELRSLRDDYVELLRWDGTGSAPIDGSGRSAGEVAREIRAVEQQIPFEQAHYLERFVYVAPLPPPPEIAGNDYAAIEPYYGDVVWVDKVVLDDKWSLSNLMVSTYVVDGQAEEVNLSHPDGDSFTIGLAFADDPIGTGLEMVEFADGTALTIRQVLDLENQDRTLIGTDNADVLTGGRGSDTLIGLAGDDDLVGGPGDDLLQGGEGSDSYDYERDTGSDVIEDLDPSGADLDSVSLVDIAPAEVTATSDSGYLRLAFAGSTDGLSIRWDPATGYGVEEVAFEDGTVWDQAMLESLLAPEVNVVNGTAGAESLTGTSGQDDISGLGGDDVLSGLGGDDRLDGGTGADQMLGGPGDDTYVVSDAGDQVTENAGEGTDTVESSVSLALSAEVENLVLTGGTNLTGTGNALDNVITGNSGNNTLDGGDGADTLTGGAGADTLLGGAGDDAFLVNGDEGPDTFNGGTGFDAILGGAGDDVIRVSSFSGTNTVERIDGGAGTNTIAGTAVNNAIDLSNTEVLNVALIDGGAGNDTITGSAGNDLIQGGAGADTLAGGGGDDTFVVNGDEGPDTFNGGTGFDTILGGVGDDVIRVSSFTGANTVERIAGGVGVNVVVGTSVNNTLDFSGTELIAIARIDGAGGNDTITGSAGADTIRGFAGADTLIGGAGDDTFLVDDDEGPDTFNGGAGLDTIQGGAGDDVVRVSSFSGANTVERIDGGAGTNSIAGTAVNNTIDLSSVELLNIDLIDGGDGNDTITGSAGNDVIRGGTGADTLAGGAGDDSFLVSGDEGPDTFDGGAGFDTILGGAGDDTIRVSSFSGTNTVERIDGGAGVNAIAGTSVNNTIDLSGAEMLNIALIDGGAGNDTITGSAASDVIQGGAGADTVAGGAGDDTFLVTGDEGPDTFGGGAGFDTVLGSTGNDTIRVSGFNGANAVERIDGAGGVNTVAGTAVNNTIDLSATELIAIALIDGGDGNDTITGSSGADTIQGGLGADTLRGGAGDDTFLIFGADTAADTVGGDVGFDAILGSAGDDTIRFSTYGGANTVERIDGAGGVNVIASTGVNNTLDFSATELLAIAQIDGGAGNDTVTGSAGADFITGGDGADPLRGEAGNDLVQGGLGNDTLVETVGGNLLDGGAGIDSLTGGLGAEFIAGGTGNDTVNPGAGADVIVFNAGDGQDTLNPGTGGDKTLSLGGGILYADLAFRKSSNDLVLETGATESLTFKNWYAAPTNQQFVTLQVIAEAMAGYDPGSADPLLGEKVQSFAFGALVGAFDAARAADPLLTRWELMNALLDTHLAASDDTALGGDLAYQYGLNGTLAGIGTGAAQDVVGSAQFGAQAQQLRPLATLQEGLVKLG